MASRSEGGSETKGSVWRRALERLAQEINEWEQEQYDRQRRKGQNERDNEHG